MGARGPKPTDGKQQIMSMLRLGEVASMAEASEVAGVSAQRIGQWCEAEGLDWRGRRQTRLKALWNLASKRRGARLTKAEMREESARMVPDFKRKRREKSLGSA